MPLVLTYNVNTDGIVLNSLVISETSPKPGLTSNTGIITLQSPDFRLTGVVLTLQYYSNTAKPAPNASSFLKVDNINIIASQGTDTIGVMSYTAQFYNPVPTASQNPDIGRIKKISSYIQSASGIFSQYLFGNVILEYLNDTGDRIITIYSNL